MNATNPTPVAVLAPPSPVLASPLLLLLDLREGLERQLERHASDLREFAPGLRVRRAFMAGRWVIGLHAGGRAAAGRVGGDEDFSRLDLEIAVDVPAESLTITSHSTVRQVDVRGQHDLRVTLGQDGAADDLARFVETACLEFAARYFER